jgi:hypothetical protein
MNILVRTILLLFVMVWANSSFAQAELKFANLGDFKTTGGEVIKEAKIGYRTVGKLNSDKSNAVLWPTWFTGTSEQILQWGILNNTIDTTGLYVIIVDALGNGVSSAFAIFTFSLVILKSPSKLFCSPLLLIEASPPHLAKECRGSEIATSTAILNTFLTAFKLFIVLIALIKSYSANIGRSKP